MITDSPGIIIVDRNSTNHTRRPLTLRITSAYATKVEVSTCATVITSVAPSELTYWRISGMICAAVARLFQVMPCTGQTAGG